MSCVPPAGSSFAMSPAAVARWLSSTALDETTGRSPRASCQPTSHSRTARCAKSRRRRGCGAGWAASSGSTEYRDRRDRPKVVVYWLMDVIDGEFAPSDEVDEMRWLELTIAVRALTYERDRDLVASLDAVSLAQSG